ncbi:MAG TPA: tetratricopeptide repeat protein, partial [Anaerolineales bacterium]|nr:tetratricopeptide repeat protein [Anaerolineales bacterium]
WRAPLAVAWGSLAQREALATRLAVPQSPSGLRALTAALRANDTEPDAAAALVRASSDHLEFVLANLVGIGEVSFASAVACAAGPVPPVDADSDSEVPPSKTDSLRRRLQASFEDRRRDLARLTDELAEVAEHDGDRVTAIEARRHALQLDPSESRLAQVALALAEAGDAAGALSLLPPSPASPMLSFAAGMGYLKGGAIEKGRILLVDSALTALDGGEPRPTQAMAEALAACGEPALALDIYRARVDAFPTDGAARHVFAKALAEDGDYASALAQVRLAQTCDEPTEGLKAIEAQALRRLGRPAEALAILKSMPATDAPAVWAETVECAIDGAKYGEAEALLAEPPADSTVVERVLLAAKVLAAQGRHAEAVSRLETAAAQGPSESGLWLALAEIQRHSGDSEAAAETLRRATQMAPGSASIHAALSRTLIDLGRPSDALAAAEEGLKADPRSGEANLEVGRALVALGRPAQAVEPLRRAHRRLPADLPTRVALAGALESVGELAPARALFNHLPDSAPADAWLMAGRLDLADEQGIEPAQAKRAAARLLRARTLGARDPALGYWLARAFENAGEPGHAAEAYAEFLHASPRDPRADSAGWRRGECLLQAGDPLAAIKAFEALRGASAHDAKVLESLARAYLSVTLLDEARQAAEGVLALDPTHRGCLGILATVSVQRGEWKRTAEAFHTAAALASDDIELWMGAAEASLKAGDAARAQVALEKTMSVPDAPFRRRAAHVLVGLGKAAEATQSLTSVAEQMPTDAEVWIELADVAESSGDLPISI